LYTLNCVPMTGVFVRVVAVGNTNLAAVRTSEVRMTSMYFSGGSTEVGAGVQYHAGELTLIESAFG